MAAGTGRGGRERPVMALGCGWHVGHVGVMYGCWDHRAGLPGLGIKRLGRSVLVQIVFDGYNQ